MIKKYTCAFAAIVTIFSLSVYAACGDSKCSFENGQFKCTVKTPDGDVVCTEQNPCTIRCS